MATRRASSFRSYNRRCSSSVATHLADFLESLGGECAGLATCLRERKFGSAFPKQESVADRSDSYVCARAFRRDYLVSELFSKFDPGIKSEEEARVERALSRFAEAEERCSEANERLASMESLPLFNGVTTSSVIFSAARKISFLLGDPDLQEISEGFGFGPGASTRLPRRRSDLYYKFGGIPETTSSNAAFALAVLQSVPGWKPGPKGSKCVSIRDTNRIVTVPKNAETERTIAIEPCMNIFVQKGVGRVIRNRLRKVGIDLNDQSMNQDLAWAGSVDGSLATIDLSMASDTVCTEIVRQLLPPHWFSILEQMRTPGGILPSGGLVTYQKFSSMGNGFTFELESLIFWALCMSVVDLLGLKDRRVGVYGDDLIVPVDAVEPLLKVLDFCGFKPNPKKTFTVGHFRESCGKHFFRGIDVTPFYVRKPVLSHDSLFLLHNNATRWLYDAEINVVESHGHTAQALAGLRSCADHNWRKPRIPLFGAGDGAFVGPFDRAVPVRLNPKRGWEGWKTTVLMNQSVLDEKEGETLILKGLYQLERRHAARANHNERQRVERPNVLGDIKQYLHMAYLSSISHDSGEASVSGVLGAKERFAAIQVAIPRWDDVLWLEY